MWVAYTTVDVVMLQILWVLDMVHLVSVAGTLRVKTGGQEKDNILTSKAIYHVWPRSITPVPAQ